MSAKVFLPAAPFGLLQPIPPPTAIWEDIAIDFIVGLPAHQDNTVIMVVSDRFSKAAHFGSLPTKFSTRRAAELFTNIICKLQGYLKGISLDRDPIFLSNFWRTLFQLKGKKLRMSAAYYPKTDYPTEVLNRYLEQYLQSFCIIKNFLHGENTYNG